MAHRDGYSKDEWESVVELLDYAPVFVIAFGPHSGIVTARETLAYSTAIGAIDTAAHGSFVAEAVAYRVGDEYSSYSQGTSENTPENVERIRGEIAQRVALLDEHDPADAADFKRVVLEIATIAAAGAKDGLLGTKGEAINEHERAALDELAAVFGLTD